MISDFRKIVKFDHEAIQPNSGVNGFKYVLLWVRLFFFSVQNSPVP
jgi:hypothetical protein